MMLAAMTFWREMPITITLLLLATVYYVTAKDTVIGSQEKDNRDYSHVEVKKYSPRFKRPSKMYSMDLKPMGSSIRLNCAAEGNPTPNITWYKNKRTPIERNYFQPIYSKWSMTLEELTRSDNGNYTCIVCNELDCIEHTVTLRVQERYPSKPYIKDGCPGNITVHVNETVQLSCPPLSDLEPYIYWIKPVNYSANEMEELIPVGDVIESENLSDKPEFLTLYNVTQEDEGWYVCVALNTLGNTTAKGYLTVIESTSTNITETKNKYEKIELTITKVLKEMFDEFSKKQETHFQEIRHDIEVMSTKYNEFYSKMEEEKLKDKKTIKHLEENIEELERKNRYHDIKSIAKV